MWENRRTKEMSWIERKDWKEEWCWMNLTFNVQRRLIESASSRATTIFSSFLKLWRKIENLTKISLQLVCSIHSLWNFWISIVKYTVCVDRIIQNMWDKRVEERKSFPNYLKNFDYFAILKLFSICVYSFSVLSEGIDWKLEIIWKDFCWK